MKFNGIVFLILLCSLTMGNARTSLFSEKDGVFRNVVLPPGPDNPRNSASDLIQLKNGDILLMYSHFYGGKTDHASAYIASRRSTDGGKTWTDKDKLVVKHEGGLNVMCVNLLRLQDGRIAFFYLRKNSLEDCRPVLCFSSDEGETWTEPKEVIKDEIAYYVLNNDRAHQLDSGRLIIPVAIHKKENAGRKKGNRFSGEGRVMTYFSDDLGETWKRSNVLAIKMKGGLQEPGVVALKDGNPDGNMMLFARTNAGSQFVSYSKDHGETWSEPKPSNIKSPLSPASIKRIPSTGDLLLIWNENYEAEAKMSGARTPFVTAISKDDGKTWIHKKALETDPDGSFCYTAIEFVGDKILLSHNAGSQSEKTDISVTRVTGFPVSWLYGGEAE